MGGGGGRRNGLGGGGGRPLGDRRGPMGDRRGPDGGGGGIRGRRPPFQNAGGGKQRPQSFNNRRKVQDGINDSRLANRLSNRRKDDGPDSYRIIQVEGSAKHPHRAPGTKRLPEDSYKGPCTNNVITTAMQFLRF